MSLIAFSLDGRLIATGGDYNEKSVKIWDANSGKHLHTFLAREGGIDSLAFSLDGSKLASGGGDRIARIWDTNSGKNIHTLLGHGGGVDCLSFSLDGSKLASGSGDHTVRIWDVELGTSITVLSGHSDSVKQVDFSEDGRKVTSRTAARTYTWDLEHPDSPTDTVLSGEPDKRDLGMYGRSRGPPVSMGGEHWLFMGRGRNERRVGAVPEEFRVSGFSFYFDRLVITDIGGSVLILDISRLRQV